MKFIHDQGIYNSKFAAVEPFQGSDFSEDFLEAIQKVIITLCEPKLFRFDDFLLGNGVKFPLGRSWGQDGVKRSPGGCREEVSTIQKAVLGHDKLTFLKFTAI